MIQFICIKCGRTGFSKNEKKMICQHCGYINNPEMSRAERKGDKHGSKRKK